MLQGRFFAFPPGVTMKAFAVTLAACASRAHATLYTDLLASDSSISPSTEDVVVLAVFPQRGDPAAWPKR